MFLIFLLTLISFCLLFFFFNNFDFYDIDLNFKVPRFYYYFVHNYYLNFIRLFCCNNFYFLIFNYSAFYLFIYLAFSLISLFFILNYKYYLFFIAFIIIMMFYLILCLVFFTFFLTVKEHIELGFFKIYTEPNFFLKSTKYSDDDIIVINDGYDRTFYFLTVELKRKILHNLKFLAILLKILRYLFFYFIIYFYFTLFYLFVLWVILINSLPVFLMIILFFK